MESILSEERFAFLKDTDKAFIIDFNNRMNELGYDFGNHIGSGVCWGKYMLIYTKTGAKSKNVVARIYMRDDGIVLRLFLNGIDKHREYIESSTEHILDVFTNTYGDCGRCHNDKNGVCKFRKAYIINHRNIEKCNGRTFEFWYPEISGIPDYMGLLAEFYPRKKGR